MGRGDIAAVSALLAVAESVDGHRPLGEHQWLDLVQGGREGFAGLVAWEPGHDHPVGYAQISRGKESWALEFVVDPHHRDRLEPIGADVVGAALDVVANEGGGHVHMWVPKPRPEHDRITYLTGSSTSGEVVSELERVVAGSERVLVILDSDHSRDHVLDELRIYSRFVTPGSYLIVEDTNVNGHPVYPYHGPGPKEAVDAFLAETSEFATDLDCEKFYLTFNPSGYLKKRGAASGSSASA